MVYSVKKNKWWFLLTLCVAQMAVMVDNTILNVALPSIGRSLNAGTAGAQGAVLGYSLAQAAVLLTAGAVADAVGHRRMLVAGLALFGLGSLAAACSPGIAWLIAARVVMGLGGGCLMTSTLAVITVTFDEASRARAIGLWAATGSAAFMAGPLLGGALLRSWWWGSVFLVNVPVVVVAMAAIMALAPRVEASQVRVDWAGTALWAGAMASFLPGVTLLAADLRWGSTLVTAGVLLATGFVLVERRQSAPMLPLSVLAVPAFAAALVGALIIAFAMGGSMFLLTLDFQVAQGLSPLVAGARMIPLAATVVVVNTVGLGAHVVQRAGVPVTVAGGMVLLGAGMGLFPLMRGQGVVGQSLVLVVTGLGIGLAMPAMANALMTALPPERAGIAAGVNGTVQEFGTSIGVAALGAVAAIGWRARGEGPLTSAAPGEVAARAISLGQLSGAAVLLLGAVLIPLLLRRVPATPAVTTQVAGA